LIPHTTMNTISSQETEELLGLIKTKLQLESDSADQEIRLIIEQIANIQKAEALTPEGVEFLGRGCEELQNNVDCDTYEYGSVCCHNGSPWGLDNFDGNFMWGSEWIYSDDDWFFYRRPKQD